jgi:hypothetical protein
MATLERGFKTWAERTSGAIRNELSLPSHAPLDPKKLAFVLGVRLATPEEFPGLPKDTSDQLLLRDPGGWSAVTLSVGGKSIVIYNPKHSHARQASDIAHELAHLILEHQPAKMVISLDGAMVMRSYNSEQEDEANWLAWCLLLPREALLQAKRTGMSTAEIAEAYGVSESLVDFRLGITGVRAFLARGRKKSGGSSPSRRG